MGVAGVAAVESRVTCASADEGTCLQRCSRAARNEAHFNLLYPGILELLLDAPSTQRVEQIAYINDARFRCSCNVSEKHLLC